MKFIEVKEETKPVLFLILAWLCLALACGLAGWFRNATAPGVAAIVWILTGLCLLACWKVQLIREAVAAFDLRGLIALHLTRFVGVYFLILRNRGELPVGFATPAGIGDITIAAGAVLLLLVPFARSSRPILFAWNTLGLVDIIFVVFSAFRFGLKDWPGMAPLRALPLSLLPTFIVPLIIVSNVLIFIRLRSAEFK